MSNFIKAYFLWWKRVFVWWQDYTIGTWLYTKFKGKKVGRDGEGNVYYQSKDGRKRWVLYNGEVEASRVPPEWHLWLHKTVAEPPTIVPVKAKEWEKPHQANQTGGKGAYYPPGSLERGGKRPPADGDYEAWKP